MRVNLNSYPSYAKTYVVDFPKLNGGLNIRELNYRLEVNQSPSMKNLWWQDGVLQCRNGQRYLADSEELGTGWACADEPFWNHAFFHIGAAIYAADLAASQGDESESTADFTLTPVLSGIPQNRGTFFRYDGCLFYKNRGGFYKISYSVETAVFTAVDMSLPVNTHTPIIVINASPSNGSGTTYQPENRLSPYKEVHYNAAEDSGVVEKTGDGTTTVFNLGKTAAADRLTRVASVYVNHALTSPTVYTVDIEAGTVTFTSAPPKDEPIEFNLRFGVNVYHLPVKPVDAVTLVKVDGAEKTAETDYTVDLTEGTVTFPTAPPVTNPPTNNTVEITYSKANAEALASIMDCCYATVAGNGNNLCILLAGCPAQSNAVFWNSNDQYAMDPSYFPMTYYNLCGDSEEVVTGFGKQYNDLILFKNYSVGKLVFDVQAVDERDSISFTYQRINSKIGCDLPWSIQLVENNLVFCNTSRGVHYVASSSAAYENNIICISDKVNGDGATGLLHDIRNASVVTSTDDNERYWLCAGDHVYLWDYHVSTAGDPSWFFFTDVAGIAYLHDASNRLYHLDASGRVTVFERVFTDYGEAISKLYTFPTQYFGSYDRLKDVLYLLVTVRSDTDTEIKLRYDTDYERRVDLTPIQSFTWRLVPRNLAIRCLAPFRYGHVAKRKPGCRHIRHFELTLENNEKMQDLAIVSAQIYYRYSGRER